MTVPGDMNTVNYLQRAREILTWYFGLYFDGHVHSIADTNITCPNCTITAEVNRKIPAPLVKPEIFINVSGGEPVQYRTPKTGGAFIMHDIEVMFFVSCSSSMKSPERTRDFIQEIITLLLATNRVMLAAKGLKMIASKSPMVLNDERQQAVSYSSATFRTTRIHAVTEVE